MNVSVFSTFKEVEIPVFVLFYKSDAVQLQFGVYQQFSENIKRGIDTSHQGTGVSC
ncbi:hypothetical protein BPIT_18170 [Candidatus Brocadia pituitae]|nr:hypothetical protein BPIT_18170 [Candidatus Brocadia pituitae]